MKHLYAYDNNGNETPVKLVNGRLTDVSEGNSGTDLIKQPHGGALRPGGMLGNRGGYGRPAKAVQARSRALYDAVLQRLEQALEDAGQPLTQKQLVAMGSMAGRFAGLGDEDAPSGNVRVTIVQDDGPVVDPAA